MECEARLRKITLILIFILCLTGLFYADKSFALDTKELSKEEVSKLPEDSMDKIYQDLIICSVYTKRSEQLLSKIFN